MPMNIVAQEVEISQLDIFATMNLLGIDLQAEHCSYPNCSEEAVAPVIVDGDDGFACAEHVTNPAVSQWVIKYVMPMKVHELIGKLDSDSKDDKSFIEKVADVGDQVSDIVSVMNKTREQLIASGWSEHMAENVAASLIIHRTEGL